MAKIKDNDVIIRYENDTYPETGNIEVNGSPVDISDYDVYFYYKEGTKLIRITATKPNAKEGRVAFYPKVTHTQDVTDKNNPVDCEAFTVPGEYIYAIVRSRTIYEPYSDGLYVNINDEFVLYDANNPDHADKDRFTLIEDKMTHKTGKLIISARVGL